MVEKYLTADVNDTALKNVPCSPPPCFEVVFLCLIMKEQFLCLKDLIHQDGTKSFTKGNIYYGNPAKCIESVTLLNNQLQSHVIGIWAKYFKRI